MGYDAFIHCKCFEKGKTKPFKYKEYLYRDSEAILILIYPHT